MGEQRVGESKERAADEIWCKRETAAYLKVSERQLDRLTPPIPVIDCGPRSKRFRKVDVLAWLAARAHPQPHDDSDGAGDGTALRRTPRQPVSHRARRNS